MAPPHVGLHAGNVNVGFRARNVDVGLCVGNVDIFIMQVLETSPYREGSGENFNL
jgi:hypothetical protein